MKRLIFVALLAATPAAAQTAMEYLNLPLDTCIKRGPLLATMKEKGFTVETYRDITGGRRQAYYVHKTLGYNLPIMFFRGADNALSADDCSIIFADSDPGIFPPTAPLWE